MTAAPTPTRARYVVELHHKLNPARKGLRGDKVLPLPEAETFDAYMAAKRAMNTWIGYGDGERRVTWSAEVIDAKAVTA